MLFIFLLFSTLFLYFFWHFYYKRRGLPPGPTPFPLVGNLLAIGRSGPGKEDIYVQWRRTYGPVYTYWLGGQPVICVADYGKIVETFIKQGDTFAGRPDDFEILGKFNKDKGSHARGISCSNGAEWREQRRFAIHVLRDLGVGKSRIERHILQELEAMMGRIDAKLDEQREKEAEIDLAPYIELAVGSTINAMMFGHRLEGPEEEAELLALKQEMVDVGRDFQHPLAVILTWHPSLLVHIPPFKSLAQKLDAQIDAIFGHFERKIVKHKVELELSGEEGEEAEEPQDFVDAFLREIRSRKNGEGNNGNGHYFSMEELRVVCFDLWVAGQFTTPIMFTWGLAHLLHHPKYLDQLWHELDDVIGGKRMVTMADRTKLPFTNAIVNESLRVGNFVVSNVIHALTKDTQLDGFQLPKGTWIVPQIPALTSDDTIFPDAARFNPYHFLDESGNLRKRDELIPFSIGKRQCPGESLGRMQLFLLVANIFNQYKLLSGMHLPSLKCATGTSLINKCQPFTCKVQKRQ